MWGKCKAGRSITGKGEVNRRRGSIRKVSTAGRGVGHGDKGEGSVRQGGV